MTTKAFANHYALLTAEERFRLIVAAGSRGDEAEQERLRHASREITLATNDYTPWSRAFDELATLVFLELIEEAASHHDAFHRWDEAAQWHADLVRDSAPSQEIDRARRARKRYRHLYLGQGFILKTKAAGWMLFCEHLAIPPFALWRILPGIDRLQRALMMVDVEIEGETDATRPLRSAAFTAEQMQKWLRANAPKDKRDKPLAPVTAEGFADRLATVFHVRVRWWGG